MMKRTLCALAIFALLLSACSTAPKCSREDYNTTVEPLLEEWDDAVSVANQTPRMGLPNVIPNLQEIKRRASDLEIDECFVDAHSFLIKYMEYTIEAFLAFMSQESDSVVQGKFSLAETNFETYLLRMRQVEQE